MAKKATKKVAKKAPKQAGQKVPMKKSASGIGITPLAERVVVRPLSEDELGTKSPAGIIIPETVSKEKPEQGVVVAVGAGKWNEHGDRRIPMAVAVGDRVLFSKYGYDEVKVGGTEYYVVSESSLLAVISA